MRVKARGVKARKVRPKNVSKNYENAFLMKPGPAQKTKIRGVKVRSRRRL